MRDQFPEYIGHVYGGNADDGEGNIFFHRYNTADNLHYNRDADSWDKTSIVPCGGFTAGPTTAVVSGCAWHPNAGDQGTWVVMGRTKTFAWDKATGVWSTIFEQGGDQRYGVGCYVPGLDSILIGQNQMYLIDSDLNVSLAGPPPIPVVAGTSGGKVSVKVIHPSNNSMVILIEKYGAQNDPATETGRVWSTVNGEEWALQQHTNPLYKIGNEGSVVCSLPDHGSGLG